MSERAFSASYDSTTRAISAAVCLLLMVVAWVVHMVFIALLFPLLIGLAYAYSPRGYAISGGAIVVQRLIGNIRVPLAEIREMRAGTREDFTGCLRLWGNGGLFGYYGVYQTTKLGKCYWYVTNRSKTVIVATQSRILVLSPDDLAGFIGAAGVPSTGVTSGDAPPFQLGTAWGNVTGKLVANRNCRVGACADFGHAALFAWPSGLHADRRSTDHPRPVLSGDLAGRRDRRRTRADRGPGP